MTSAMRSRGSPPRILLIDDDPEDRTMIVRSLRTVSSSIVIDEAANGSEGLDRIAASDPDLVLLDLRMPGIDGFQVLERTKSNARYALLPIVVLSTSDNIDDVRRAYGMHANAYVQKPSTVAEYRRLAARIWDFWFETAVLC